MSQLPIPEDNLDDDIRVMLRDSIRTDPEGHFYTNHNVLREKLTVYIVQRDQKIWNHAYQIGKREILNKSRIGGS